jgi:proline iminopeptidase
MIIMKNLGIILTFITIGLLNCIYSLADSPSNSIQFMESQNGIDTGTIVSGKFRLHYQIQGTGIPTIVVGNSTYYPRIFSPGLYSKLRLVFLDHRGFVRPPSTKIDTTAYSLDTLINDIELARKSLKLGRVAIIGHSGHAYMALEYAKKYPNNVSHIILIGAPPEMGKAYSTAYAQKWRDSASTERKAIVKMNYQKYPDSLLAKLTTSERYILNNIRNGPRYWYNPNFDPSPLWEGTYVNTETMNYVWGKVFPRLDIKIGLEKLKIPVFLALGLYDYALPPISVWEPLKTKFKDLTIRVFKYSGHTPPYEEPMLFNKELLSWIDNHH